MKVFSTEMLESLTQKAAASERRRAHLTLHSGPEDRVQRFFVSAVAGTYFRPHRHSAKSELAIIVAGAVDLLTFDDQGTVTSRFTIGAGAPNVGFETPRGTWHTLLVLEPRVTFVEIKEGPYDPSSAAEFALWSPAEGAPGARAFLARLTHAQAGTNIAFPPASAVGTSSGG